MSTTLLRNAAGRVIAAGVIVSLVLSLFTSTLSARAAEGDPAVDPTTVTEPAPSATETPDAPKDAAPAAPTDATDVPADQEQAGAEVTEDVVQDEAPSIQALAAAPAQEETAPAQPTNVVRVTPTLHRGWTFHTFDEVVNDEPVDDTGTGSISFVHDASASGTGALRLSVPATDDEALIDRAEGPTAVNQINLSYQSKRLSGSDTAAPAYILGIDTDGDAVEDLYAFYEPVYNDPDANFDDWNTWTVNQDANLWSFGGDEVGTKGGVNGGNFFTLRDVEEQFPGSTVVEYTVNIGSGTPGTSVLVDNVMTPAAIYDFEPNSIETYTVTPNNLQGWTEHEYGTGASATYVEDADADGNGALQLSTTDTSGEVLYDLEEEPTPVELIDVSYTSRRVAGSASVEPAYIFGVDKDGSPNTQDDILYVFYEPVYNNPDANFDEWNTWTVDQTSKLWSFDVVSEGKGGVNGGNFFTFQDVKAAYPTATVVEYTLNLGSGTPDSTVLVDMASTPNAIYNFDQVARSTHHSSGGGGHSGQSVPTEDTTQKPAADEPTQGSTGGEVLGESTFQFTVDLHVGSLGNDVTELQKMLIAAGYLHIDAPTGYFGLLTRAAVAAFQSDHGITPAAGFFGPITRALVNAYGLHSLTAPSTTSGATTTTSSTTTTY